ncbi:glycosyltransferase [Micromonospora sp. WMMA1363]|uniref:glycosyltransferase n=1 Tax=Micromonospora sp. WMMA1363 TaxID=3053985 RepID=UPI00259D2998|nr:glycosyltransferase [Micromonospora sp. WMMA1363]MDM4718573.1 glycosyltransferase [Micromonospora sp. WMMA1363]
MIAAVKRAGQDRLRRIGHARELRRRTPPPVRYDESRPGPGVVYYLSPDDDKPSGGIRNLYRHVDLLNESGIPAAVLHARPGFRAEWFANDTRVAAAGDVTLGPSDLLVVPEYFGPGLDRLPAPVRKLVFNQNAYHTFAEVPVDGTAAGAPYRDCPGIEALVTVSRDNAALLRHAFPDLDVHLARVVVDAQVFHPPARPAAPRIGHMPRRRAAEQEQLLHILRSRGVLAGWELVPIDGLTEAQTAEALRSCAVFLSFSEREGFGLPPAEAMASGAYVVGFTGLAGRDFFDPRYCAPVAEGDLLGYAVAVERALRRYQEDPSTLVAAGHAAAERIRSEYHADGLRADLASIYQTYRNPAAPDRSARGAQTT